MTDQRPPTVGSFFKDLKEGETIIYHLPTATSVPYVSRGDLKYGEDIFGPLLAFTLSATGRMKVDYVQRIVSMASEALELSGFVLWFHEAYNAGGVLNRLVTDIETSRSVAEQDDDQDDDNEYDSVQELHYRVLRAE